MYYVRDKIPDLPLVRFHEFVGLYDDSKRIRYIRDLQDEFHVSCNRIVHDVLNCPRGTVTSTDIRLKNLGALSRPSMTKEDKQRFFRWLYKRKGEEYAELLKILEATDYTRATITFICATEEMHSILDYLNDLKEKHEGYVKVFKPLKATDYIEITVSVVCSVREMRFILDYLNDLEEEHKGYFEVCYYNEYESSLPQ